MNEVATRSRIHVPVYADMIHKIEIPAQLIEKLRIPIPTRITARNQSRGPVEAP
jgi:hypothetical protein